MKRGAAIRVLALAVCATGGMALAFGALILGAQPAFAQGKSIDPGASAVSLNGRIGQRFTLTCPAISEARNSIWGTDIYTADSPVCQAALHAGVLQPGQTGMVAIEIRPGASEYVGSTRNGVTTRSYGPNTSSYTFVAAETAPTPAGAGAALAPTRPPLPALGDVPGPAAITPADISVPPALAGTAPVSISAPSGPPTTIHPGAGSPLRPTTNISAGNEMSPMPPTTAPAGNDTPPTLPTTIPASNDTPPPSAAPSGNGVADPTAGNAVAKKVLAAVAQAINVWQQQARLTGQVQGTKLTTSPGGLTGPSLEPLIEASLIAQGVAPNTAGKFAQAFSDAWQQWQASFMVPGLQVYPAFAAWPGPQAPPTANVPFPVVAGYSPHLAAMSESALRSALLARFPGATPQQEQAIVAFSSAAANNFISWCAYTQVTKVMGSGPVPTFAPPAVPLGQVMGGTAMMLPGGLVGPGFLATGIP